jgi:hypothetical protein
MDLPDYINESTIVEAIDFGMEYLGLFDVAGEISVDFEKVDFDGLAGFCIGDDGEYSIHINAEYDNQMVISTIFHELVHVEQIVSGRLVQSTGRNHARWNDESWPSTQYEKYPWEVEAYGTEKLMYEKWSKLYEGR